MKIKKPSLTGMKHTEYLGRFKKDKFIQDGHNTYDEKDRLVNKGDDMGGGGGPGGGIDVRSAAEYVAQKFSRNNWNAQKEGMQKVKASERATKVEQSGRLNYPSKAAQDEWPAIKKMSGEMPRGAQKAVQEVTQKTNKAIKEDYKRAYNEAHQPVLKEVESNLSLARKAKEAQNMASRRRLDQQAKQAKESLKKNAAMGAVGVGVAGAVAAELFRKRKKK